jgi:hypothetical protein
MQDRTEEVTARRMIASTYMTLDGLMDELDE